METAEPAAREAAAFTVGLWVRVVCKDAAHRAVILCVHDEASAEPRYEVELHDGTEMCVVVGQLRRLEKFESGEGGSALIDWPRATPRPNSTADRETATSAPPHDSGSTLQARGSGSAGAVRPSLAVDTATRLKEQGNVLYKLRDFDAALEQHLCALRSLHVDAPVSVGARVLVKGESGIDVRAALVMSVDDVEAEILFERPEQVRTPPPPLVELMRIAASIQEAAAADGEGSSPAGGNHDGLEDDGEEARVGVGRLIPIHPNAGALQCAVLLNMARCSLSTASWTAALARALRVRCIAATDAKEPQRTVPLQRSALAVCARAALGMQRFRRATMFAAELLAAPLPADKEAAAKATQATRLLLRDISSRVNEVRRSNKRLARDLSEWVNAAMEQQQQQQELRSRQGDVSQQPGSGGGSQQSLAAPSEAGSAAEAGVEVSSAARKGSVSSSSATAVVAAAAACAVGAAAFAAAWQPLESSRE